MPLKNSILLLALILLTFWSCTTGVTFNPDFHKADHNLMAIVPEKGEPILCEMPRFSDFACMSDEKIKELRALLLKARLPKEDKIKVINALDRMLNR